MNSAKAFSINRNEENEQIHSIQRAIWQLRESLESLNL